MGVTNMKTWYEWDVETNDQHGDVLDHDHADKLWELMYHYSDGLDASTESLVLVYNTGSELDGLLDRSWAYVNDSWQLPEYFQNGVKVPKRFHDEIKEVFGG